MLAGRLIAEVNQPPELAIANCSWGMIAFRGIITLRRTVRAARAVTCLPVECRHTNGRGGDLVYTNSTLYTAKTNAERRVPIRSSPPRNI